MQSPDDRTILVSPKRPTGQSAPPPNPRSAPPSPSDHSGGGRLGASKPLSAPQRSKSNLTGLLLLTGIIGTAFGISFAITLRWSNPQLSGPGLFGRIQLFSPKNFPGQRLENSTFQGSEGAFERPGGEGRPQAVPEEPPVMQEEVLPRKEALAEPAVPAAPSDPLIPDQEPVEPEPAPGANSRVTAGEGGPVESEPIPPSAEVQEPAAASTPIPEPTIPEPTAPVAPPAQ